MPEGLIALDRSVYEWVTVFLNRNGFLEAAEFIVDSGFITGVLLLAFLPWLIRQPRQALWFALFCVILLLCSEATVQILKHSVMRDRPAIAMGRFYRPGYFSFPSAHSVNTAALAVFIIRVKGWRYWPALFIPILIGFARMYANYHFPADILIGFFTGALLALAWYHLLVKIPVFAEKLKKV